MDISLHIPMSGATPSYTPPVPTTANTDSAPVIVPPKQPAPVQSSSATAVPTPDIHAQYEAAIRQTVLSFKNFYAISDKEFSIFKDASGQYITRYVSLRDGTVTYTPAPVFIRNMQAAGESISSLQPAIEV